MDKGSIASQIEDMLANNRDELVAAAKERVAEKLIGQFDYHIDYQTKEQVSKELVELVKPMIADAVAKHKDAIQQSIDNAIINIGVIVAEEMTKKVRENVTGWNGRQIFEKMFQ